MKSRINQDFPAYAPRQLSTPDNMNTVVKIIILVTIFVTSSIINASENKDVIVINNVRKIFFQESLAHFMTGHYSVMYEDNGEFKIKRLDKLSRTGGWIVSVRILKINEDKPMKVELIRTIPGQYWAIIYIHGPNDISGTSSR